MGSGDTFRGRAGRETLNSLSQKSGCPVLWMKASVCPPTPPTHTNLWELLIEPLPGRQVLHH